ncbi:MAG: virulence factor MviN, partial [uncultured bacterium]
MNTILKKGKQILLSQQSSVISAASVIMLMVVASRILGLVRQRVLAHFFLPEELSLFFAAFRLPDLLFEVLVFGTFSSAFIPVFTKSLKKGDTLAWDIAGRVVNIGLVIFIPIAIIFSFNAEAIYSYVAPGFSVEEIQII